MVSDLERLAASTRAAFEETHLKNFRTDPTRNPRLTVEVVAPAMVDQTPTMILITPWTLDGLMFLPEESTIRELMVGERRFPVLEDTLDGIGAYTCIHLVPDVRGLATQKAARHAAATLAEPFRQAVTRAFEEQSVANPDRRDLFKRLAGGGST